MPEGGFDAAVDVGIGFVLFRVLAAARDFRNDQRRQDADDGDDQQDFNEREAALRLFDFCWVELGFVFS